MTRALLPRTSSATSGFFFCGMIDEPVQYASPNSMKSNCADIQRINSSLMRDRCTMSNAAAAMNSIQKSRSLTASMEFSQIASKPSSSADISRSMG